jgi:MFS family permease
VVSVVSSSALVLSPLFGVILDKFGHRGHAVLLSSYGLTLGFIIFCLSQNVYLMLFFKTFFFF